jgi:pimeloyl-ACP methyl ester carboxylesterase
MTATIRTVKVGDVAISIAETGVGGRPLLMQHGFMGAKEDFADWWDALAERGWHVVAPDLRGHGASDHPAGRSSYSVPILQADLLGLIDALGWTRLTLLGHSLGGILAQGVAIGHPELLDALVLMDTIPGAASMGGGGWRFAVVKLVVRVRGIQAIAGFVKKPPPGSPESVVRLYAERPGFVEWTQQKIRNTSTDLATSMMPQLGKLPDRTEQLRSLDLPTLVIAGEHDIPGFVDGSRRMADAIQGARLVVIDGAAHSPQLETPDAWWEALTAFLDDLPDTTRPQAEDLT